MKEVKIEIGIMGEIFLEEEIEWRTSSFLDAYNLVCGKSKEDLGMIISILLKHWLQK